MRTLDPGRWHVRRCAQNSDSKWFAGLVRKHRPTGAVYYGDTGWFDTWREAMNYALASGRAGNSAPGRRQYH